MAGRGDRGGKGGGKSTTLAIAVNRLRLVASSFRIADPDDRSALVMGIANAVPVLIWTRTHGLDGAADAVERVLADLPAG